MKRSAYEGPSAYEGVDGTGGSRASLAMEPFLTCDAYVAMLENRGWREVYARQNEVRRLLKDEVERTQKPTQLRETGPSHCVRLQIRTLPPPVRCRPRFLRILYLFSSRFSSSARTAGWQSERGPRILGNTSNLMRKGPWAVPTPSPCTAGTPLGTVRCVRRGDGSMFVSAFTNTTASTWQPCTFLRPAATRRCARASVSQWLRGTADVPRPQRRRGNKPNHGSLSLPSQRTVSGTTPRGHAPT